MIAHTIAVGLAACQQMNQAIEIIDSLNTSRDERKRQRMQIEATPRRPPTLDDVARRANVSRQTISRVINNKDEIRESTRQRVLVAIQELGYQPNTLARALASNKSADIGIVVPDIAQPFYPEIARGVEDGAYQAGYSVFLCHTARDPKREIQALERLRGHRVAGAIICNSRLDDETLEHSLVGGFPVVLVNRLLPNSHATVIWPGYDTGGAMATEHLITLGRRQVVYLGFDVDTKADSDRLQGYRAAHERAGIPCDPARMLRAPNTFRGGYDAMASLARQRIAVDGLFASTDVMAIGAMRYAATHHISIPAEIAVVGFGGSDIADMITPALSTIAVPLYTIGVTAVQELLDLINGKGEEQRQVHTEPTLVVRGSSCAEAERPDGWDGALREEADRTAEHGLA